MDDNRLIEMAKEIPYMYWWNIEILIDSAKTDEIAEKLRWIMREKELLEQIKDR